MVEASTIRVLENHVLFRILNRAEVDQPTDLKAKQDASKKSILDHFTRIVARDIATGAFRHVDAHVAALAIIGMRNWSAWWYNPDGRIPKHQLADTIAGMEVQSLLQPVARQAEGGDANDVLSAAGRRRAAGQAAEPLTTGGRRKIGDALGDRL